MWKMVVGVQSRTIPRNLFDVTTRSLKGHVITARHGFCDVEKSDGNLDNIVQISVTSQGCTLRQMIIWSSIWWLELLLGVIALLVLLYADHGNCSKIRIWYLAVISIIKCYWTIGGYCTHTMHYFLLLLKNLSLLMPTTKPIGMGARLPQTLSYIVE